MVDICVSERVDIKHNMETFWKHSTFVVKLKMHTFNLNKQYTYIEVVKIISKDRMIIFKRIQQLCRAFIIRMCEMFYIPSNIEIHI